MIDSGKLLVYMFTSSSTQGFIEMIGTNILNKESKHNSVGKQEIELPVDPNV